MKTFTIQPHNEGHALDYVETLKAPSIAPAIERGTQILSGLQRVLPKGTWAVVVSGNHKRVVLT